MEEKAAVARAINSAVKSNRTMLAATLNKAPRNNRRATRNSCAGENRTMPNEEEQLPLQRSEDCRESLSSQADKRRREEQQANAVKDAIQSAKQQKEREKK